jgi:Ca2+-binding EF-hand superfamily protein
MGKLDLDRDGEITKNEIYEALRPYEDNRDVSRYQASQQRRSPSMSQDMKVSFKQKELERVSVEEIIEKVKKGAQKYPSYKHFVSTMMRRYDTDNDGSLNFKELSQGLEADGIALTHEEKLVLMKHLDEDCDGVVSRDEIFHAMLIDARHRRNHH